MTSSEERKALRREAWEEVAAEVTDNVPVGERHVVTTVHQHRRGHGGIEVSMVLATEGAF